MNFGRIEKIWENGEKMKHKISNKEKKDFGFVYHELVAENQKDRVLLTALYQVIPGISATYSSMRIYNYSGIRGNLKSLTVIVYPKNTVDRMVPDKVFEGSELGSKRRKRSARRTRLDLV